MPIDYPLIEALLTKVEGPRQTTGYIPCYLKTGGTANYKGGPNPERYTAMGASGVTIATGCDLGQTDFATLTGYGLDPLIASVFKPYYGKRKTEAINILRRYPLVITPDAARQLDEAVHAGYLKRWVIPAYDKEARRKFEDLPGQAQAVIMSVCFQLGCAGTRRGAPKTWRYLCQQDWRNASSELINGFGNSPYKGRRAIEGRYLTPLFKG